MTLRVGLRWRILTQEKQTAHALGGCAACYRRLNTRSIMTEQRSTVNTFDLQRAIRDSDELTSTERLILLTITTYYPVCCPSRATLARGAGVHRDTLDRTLRTLKRKGALQAVARPGKPSRLVITLPHTTPHTLLHTIPPKRQERDLQTTTA